MMRYTKIAPHPSSEIAMRLLTGLSLLACALLAGCGTPSHSWADDRPTTGVHGPKPFCSSGPGGKTASCAATVGINAAIQAAQK
jgi:hypothetical protein